PLCPRGGSGGGGRGGGGGGGGGGLFLIWNPHQNYFITQHEAVQNRATRYINATALTSSCLRKAGVGGVTGKSRIGRKGHN
ncbi:MAG: hypothetical protein PV344_06175, partial [Anaplasma sp.]|nr:hypothetical protein [Anaplasma sp.]